MNSVINSASAFARPVAWTCRKCVLQTRGQRDTFQRSARYMSTFKPILKSRRKGVAVLAATGGALGLGSLAFTDDLQHGYHLLERSGRVVSTLYLCINEYGIVSRCYCSLLINQRLVIAVHWVRPKN